MHPHSLKRTLSDGQSTVHSTVSPGSNCSQLSNSDSSEGGVVGVTSVVPPIGTCRGVFQKCAKLRFAQVYIVVFTGVCV